MPRSKALPHTARFAHPLRASPISPVFDQRYGPQAWVVHLWLSELLQRKCHGYLPRAGVDLSTRSERGHRVDVYVGDLAGPSLQREAVQGADTVYLVTVDTRACVMADLVEALGHAVVLRRPRGLWLARARAQSCKAILACFTT
jgi:hypothetical protein